MTLQYFLIVGNFFTHTLILEYKKSNAMFVLQLWIEDETLININRFEKCAK